MSAREISLPVASPPACAMRSRWWPPSRVSLISPLGVAVELGAERDELADPRRALVTRAVDGGDVAEPDARDEGVVEVLLRGSPRVERGGDAALRPLRSIPR